MRQNAGEFNRLFDCRSEAWRAVQLPPELALVVIHSDVSHGHAGNEYNDRRAACERVVATVAADDPTVDHRRAYHVLTENERVQAAVAALESDDLPTLGQLMAASQASMRDDYAITCPEIDTLVEICVGVPGVVGSRMTGGGFGGCTITLAQHDAVDRLREVVEREYPARTGRSPRLWTVSASDGAGLVCVAS